MLKKTNVYETYQETTKFDKKEPRAVQKENYVFGLIMLFVKILLGIFLGGMLFPNETGGSIVCVGVLVGLTFFNKIVTFNLYGNTMLVIGFWLIKLVISAVIGVVAVPIMLGWYIYHMIEQWHSTRRG